MADNQKDVLIHIKTNAGDSIEQIIRLDAELNDLNATMRKTKDDLSKLDQEFNDGKITEGQYLQETKRLKTELEAMNAEVKNINSEQRAYRKELENAAKAYQSNEGSIKQMRAELSNMRKEYESLGKVEREGAKGTEMLSKIQQTTEELKRLEEAQGDYRRSVGHYQKALEGINPTLTAVWHTINGLSNGTMNMNKVVKNAVPLVKNLGKQFLTLLSNPIVLTITAIVMTIKELVEQFRRTDDAMTALQGLFASFQPILNVFLGLLDGIVKGLTKVIQWTTKAVTAVMSLVPAFGEASKSAQEYVTAMDELEEKERIYTVETAKNEAKISDLRAKAADKANYSAKERMKFLEEAGKLEGENLRMEMETAQEKLRLAEEDAKRRKDTSDETKQHIAELEANMWRAVKSYNDGMRSITKATQKAIGDIQKETAKDITITKFKSELKKMDEEIVNLKKKLNSIPKEYVDEWGMAVPNIEYAAQEAAIEKAQKERDEYYENNKEEAEKNSKKLLQIAKDTAKNLLDARRAYEDAVLEGMDDTLDKQLQLVENEYKREIEDLKQKLKYDENLNKEAREAINKTIDEKNKEMNRKRILTEAAYWGEVRESAREALESINGMVSDFVNSDPNRVVGAFTDTVKSTFRSVSADLSEEYRKIEAGFKAEVNALISTARNFTQYPLEGVAKVMQMITDSNGEFMAKATKSVTDFMTEFDKLRSTVKLTSAEYDDLTQLLFPYLQHIQEYYKSMFTLPDKYITSTMNKVVTLMTEKADDMKKAIMKGLDFSGISREAEADIKRLVKSVDEALAKSFNFNPLVEDYDALRDEVYKNPIKVNWVLAIKNALSSEDRDRLREMGKKYGTEIGRSFSDMLRNISGKEELDEQINYLVRNYEEAIEKITQYNNDMRFAFIASGNEVFKEAMIDESVVLPQLRHIYEYALNNDKMRVDWENERLEAEGRYVGEVDRELKVKMDLLEIEREKAKIDKSNAEYQRNYLVMQRAAVSQLEDTYNRVNAENTTKIRQLEEELIRLKETQAAFDENTPKDIVASNAATISAYEQAIEQMRKEIADALNALSNTGFMSVDDLDKTVDELTNKILSANNIIVNSTADASSLTTQLWLNSFNRVTGGLGQIGNAFNSLFTEMGELNDQWNAFAEASAYFTIGINMAEGIAEAVAAGSGVPWPANLAAIASGIAAVISGIADATSVYNQYHRPQSKFADGGLIGGHYARTRAEGRRDDVNIKASRGEYVVNADTVKKYGVEFFDRINFGRSVVAATKLRFADGGYVTSGTVQAANEAANMDNMRTMLSEVMSEIQPVVSIREIVKAQNKVKVAEYVSKR